MKFCEWSDYAGCRYDDGDIFSVVGLSCDEDGKPDLSAELQPLYRRFFLINDIIPQDQNYFTFVSVQGENIGYPVGDCFYIYDLDTIIIETTQGDDWLYLKCERTGYVEDYKLKIEKP